MSRKLSPATRALVDRIRLEHKAGERRLRAAYKTADRTGEYADADELHADLGEIALSNLSTLLARLQ